YPDCQSPRRPTPRCTPPPTSHSTSLRHLLPTCPVDGGVEFVAVVGIGGAFGDGSDHAQGKHRVRFVCEFLCRHAVAQPPIPLRILPRRFEGGEQFTESRVSIRIVGLCLHPTHQITVHSLPPGRAAGPHVRGVARRRSSRRYRVPDHRLLPATSPPAA